VIARDRNVIAVIAVIGKAKAKTHHGDTEKSKDLPLIILIRLIYADQNITSFQISEISVYQR